MKIEIRSLDFRMTHLLEATLNREITQALDHFKQNIRSVFVTIKDLNGPKGGDDKNMILRITPHQGGSLIISGRGSNLYNVIGDVCKRSKSVFSKKKAKNDDNVKKVA